MEKSGEQISTRARQLAGQLAPPPASLLETPIEYILADHFRARCLCAALRRFAEHGRADAAEWDHAANFMSRDLPLHYLDEEKDLYPTLLRRLRPEDDLACLLDGLTTEHRREQEMAEYILRILPQVHKTTAIAIGAGAAQLMAVYASSTHRHISMENSIVLVIARKRLARADFGVLAGSMKARRGINS